MPDSTEFSDSESEHDSENEQSIVISSEEEFQEQIAKHLEKINYLTNQLEITNTEHRDKLEKLVSKRAEEKELFSKERDAHAAELLTRQKRIDFLMDKCISK